jgi:hypothetical protein
MHIYKTFIIPMHSLWQSFSCPYISIVSQVAISSASLKPNSCPTDPKIWNWRTSNRSVFQVRNVILRNQVNQISLANLQISLVSLFGYVATIPVKPCLIASRPPRDLKTRKEKTILYRRSQMTVNLAICTPSVNLVMQ